MQFATPIAGITDTGHDTAPDSPIITFYPIIRRRDASVVFKYAFERQYAIQIGCIDSEDHVNADGNVLSYLMLFAYLRKDGYDPLRPIRGEKAQTHVGEQLGEIIASAARKDFDDETARIARTRDSKRSGRQGLIDFDALFKSNRRSAGAVGGIRSRVTRLASRLCDFVRDYIYGSMSIPSFGAASNAKPKLMDTTIERRRVRRGKNPSLYKGAGGVEEPLFETGRLCDAIKWRLIRCDVVSGHADARSVAALVRESQKSLKRKNTHRITASEMRRSEASDKESREKRKAAGRLSRAARIVMTAEDWLSRNIVNYMATKRIADDIYDDRYLEARHTLDILRAQARQYGVTYEMIQERWSNMQE